MNGSVGVAPVTAAETPAAEAIGLPGWAAEARKVPPGSTISAAIATIIGNTHKAFRPVEPGDIAEGDES